MVLIHDDDLARIGKFHHDKVNGHPSINLFPNILSQEVLQRDALVAHLRTSLIEIQQILCGEYLPISQFSQPSNQGP